MNKHTDIAARARILFIFVVCAFCIPLLHAEDFFFDSAGVKIHYILEGKGEPLLLIHGFGGSAQRMAGTIKELSGSYQVIALDVRGHGQSDKPHNPDAYGMEVVKDCVRLLDHRKIQKAQVVGYSMGGRIACSLVVTFPERLLSAVLGGYGWQPPGDSSSAAYRKELAESLEQGKGIGPLILRLNPIGAPPPTPEQIAIGSKMFLANNDPLALAAQSRNTTAIPTEAQLRANRVPSLALVGELDPSRPGADRLGSMMSNLKVVVIPKADHSTATRDPEYMKNVRSFLADHAGNLRIQ